jgi:hypothetical protein
MNLLVKMLLMHVREETDETTKTINGVFRLWGHSLQPRHLHNGHEYGSSLTSAEMMKRTENRADRSCAESVLGRSMNHT